MGGGQSARARARKATVEHEQKRHNENQDSHGSREHEFPPPYASSRTQNFGRSDARIGQEFHEESSDENEDHHVQTYTAPVRQEKVASKPVAKKAVKKPDMDADEDFEAMQQRILAETNDLQSRCRDEPVINKGIENIPAAAKSSTAAPSPFRDKPTLNQHLLVRSSPNDDWNINSTRNTPVSNKRANTQAPVPKGPTLSPAMQAFMLQQDRFREANADNSSSAAQEAARDTTKRLLNAHAQSHGGAPRSQRLMPQDSRASSGFDQQENDFGAKAGQDDFDVQHGSDSEGGERNHWG